MIKKEFLNLNQSLSSDKNGYQVVVTIPRRFQIIKKEHLKILGQR